MDDHHGISLTATMSLSDAKSQKMSSGNPVRSDGPCIFRANEQDLPLHGRRGGQYSFRGGTNPQHLCDRPRCE